MVLASPVLRRLPALQSPDYRRLFLSTFFTAAARFAMMLARGWLVFELTGSSFAVGLVTFAGMAQNLLVGPVAGAFADRFDRRRLAIAAGVVSMFSSGCARRAHDQWGRGSLARRGACGRAGDGGSVVAALTAGAAGESGPARAPAECGRARWDRAAWLTVRRAALRWRPALLPGRGVCLPARGLRARVRALAAVAGPVPLAGGGSAGRSADGRARGRACDRARYRPGLRIRGARPAAAGGDRAARSPLRVHHGVQRVDAEAGNRPRRATSGPSARL